MLDACPALDTIFPMIRIGFAVPNDVDLTRANIDTVFATITVVTIDDRIHRTGVSKSSGHGGIASFGSEGRASGLHSGFL